MKFFDLIFFLLISVLILSCSIIGSEYSLSDNLVYLSLFLLISPILSKNIFKIKFKKLDIIFSLILIAISCISAIVTSDFKLVFSAFLFVFLYFVGNVFIGFTYSSRFIEVIYLYICLFFSSILIFFCIISDTLEIPFKGIYVNSNSMGGMLASALIIITALIFGLLELGFRKNIKITTILIVFYLIIFYFLLMTVNRASIVAPIITLCIMYFLVNIKYIYFYNPLFLFRFNSIFLFLLFISSYLIPLDLLNNFLNKFDDKGQDVLDGRTYIWSKTLSDSGLWGQGSNYFIENFSLGAHNSFISILGRFGYVFLLFVLIIWMILGLRALIFSLQRFNNLYIYIPFLCWFGFTLLSMTEVMLYKPLMIVFFLSLSLLSVKMVKNEN